MSLVELTKTELDIINKIRYSIKKGDTYIYCKSGPSTNGWTPYGWSESYDQNDNRFN
jgi:hypothetical protein